MHELTAILSHRRAAAGDLRDAVLATVVHVRGSAYRRPGARMLIGSDGLRIGTVSGGCLETEVVRKAWWWTDGGPSLRVFDNSAEDAARDFGLGCNGVISVLLERAGAPPVTKLFAFLERAQRERRAVVMATVIAITRGGAAAIGDRVLFGADGTVDHDDGSVPLARLATAVHAAFAERSSRLLHLDDVDVFVEWVGPPQRLFVFGAGHDAEPLVAVASLMGWHVTVADARAASLQARRFPAAALVAIPPSGDISSLVIGRDDAVVLMTHNLPQDARLLPPLVAAAPRYLGLLGPRRRAEKLFADIGADVGAPNVHAPVGLAIGGDHPETIALAIAAEVQAVISGAAGGCLRALPGSIHGPALELGIATDGRGERGETEAPVACAVGYGVEDCETEDRIAPAARSRGYRRSAVGSVACASAGRPSCR